jgi:hypothetical protein
MESRELPGVSVASAARIMAAQKCWIALFPGIVAAFFLYSWVSLHIKKGFNHGVGAAIFTGLIMVGVPLAATIWLIARARVLKAIAQLATSDPPTVWHLSGKLIAASQNGAPRPELAFRISGDVLRSLTAIPKAQVS